MTTIAQTRSLVANQIGLPSNDGSIAAYQALSPADQLALTQGVINYIVNNPGEFTTAQVSTAQTQQGQANTFEIDDTGFDGGVFFSALGDEALSLGQSVASIGNGIKNTLSLTGNLLPILALGALVLFAWPYIAKARKS